MKISLPFLVCIVFFQSTMALVQVNDWSTPKGFFKENKGQIVDQNGKTNNEVLFLLEQPSMKVYLTDKGFSYEIYRCNNCDDAPLKSSLGSDIEDTQFKYESYRVDIEFVHTNKDFTIEKIDEINSKDIYYNHTLLNKEKITSTRAAKVVYKNIYEGVDIHFSANDKGEFKYDFLLQDGGTLSTIRYAVKGAGISLDANKGLLIHTPMGDIKETIPLSFTTDENGKKKDVDIFFDIRGGQNISFTSSANLNGKQLLIDPFPALQWSTYNGGDGIDMINATTSDMQGNIIVTGQTLSINNIATVGSHQANYVGDFDGFITKFDKAGVRQWSTYFGGTSTDRSNAVCTDMSGNIYVGGSTYSSTNISSTGAWQIFLESQDDAFIVKFNSDGVRQWGTYYGGNEHDYIADMMIDNNGDLVFTGHSRSNYNISTSGTHQPNLAGIENAIISKFSPSGNLLWGTYLGAGDYDSGYGVDIDLNNNIYVGGYTQSATNIATGGTFQSAFQGVLDGFIVKFNSNGTRIWGTYFGGSSIDRIWDIALDSDNNIFVVGDTESNDTIATSGAFQTTKGSFDESFLQKFDNNGQRIWGTFVGGNSGDYLYSIKCIKSSGDIVVGGYTESDINISTPSTFQPQRGGGFDAFVMKFNTNGSRYWGTYLGGTDSEEMKSLTLGDNNNIIIGGYTASLSGIATPGAHQTVYGGHVFDGFIAKLCEPLKPIILYDDSVCVNSETTLNVGSGFSSYLWSNSSTLQQTTIVPTTTGNYNYWVETVDTNNCPSNSDTISITVLPTPNIPTITLNGSVLTSSPSTNYQWYLDGSLMSGATGQSITNLSNGVYFVIITDTNGCSAESESYSHTLSTVGQLADHQKIGIYPNPTNKQLHIIFENKNIGKDISLTIFNSLGQSVFNANIITTDSQYIIPVDYLPAGVFYLSIFGDDIAFYSKFIVQH
jgi:hypothetical protein